MHLDLGVNGQSESISFKFLPVIDFLQTFLVLIAGKKQKKKKREREFTDKSIETSKRNIKDSFIIICFGVFKRFHGSARFVIFASV